MGRLSAPAAVQAGNLDAVVGLLVQLELPRRLEGRRPSCPVAAMNSVGVGEALRDQCGVKHTFVPNADSDHAIIVLHLGRVDVVGLLAAVGLADPSSPAIIMNRP